MEPSYRLLEIDPDLGQALSPGRFAQARAELLCRGLEWGRGALPDRRPADAAAYLGLLIVDGLITRRTSLAGRRCVELLGPGDLLRPWQPDEEHVVAPTFASLSALEPVRLAVLDRHASLRIGRWPEVMASLMERAIRRARVTSDALAVAQVPRVEDRLLILFWHLADRFGRVTPEGVVLPLRLSHEMLAALIGAQRPTVTAALAPLVEHGDVQRRADRTWLLTGSPEGKTVR